MQATSKPTQASLAPLLWLGVALILALLLLLATRRLSPLPIEHSALHLIHQPDGSVRVETDFTNHLTLPIIKKLRVSLGRSHEGNSGSSVAWLAQQDLSVSLSPSQTKRVACDFASSLPTYPDCAEVTLLP